MSPRIAAATAARVLWQLRRDPRTIALLLAVPCLLLVLTRYMFDGQEQTFARVGVPLLGIFPFSTMFIVTSITMLRERTTGTLERLMTMPLAKLDILVGYALAFGAVAALQALVAAALGFGLLGLESEHATALVSAVAVVNGLLGMALGLFSSAFARTEFQAVQFMPAFVLPQILLCGLLVERARMASWLETISDAMPLTYAYDALARVTRAGPLGGEFARDLAVIAAFMVAALVLGALTLRRRTP